MGGLEGGGKVMGELDLVARWLSWEWVVWLRRWTVKRRGKRQSDWWIAGAGRPIGRYMATVVDC